MARLPRYILSGHPQHIIQRGNNRSIIFNMEKDYHYYLKILKESAKEHRCAIHAYVLMTNHVHLLITPEEGTAIGKMQQMIGRYYVRYFNDKYKRTGTLWEGRYKATLIDSEQYLLTCMRYIEMNPVRAKIVTSPEEYRWSSYRANAMGEENALIEYHSEFRGLGQTDAERQEAYVHLFNNGLSNQMLRDIRFATNSSWILGTEKFSKKIEKIVNRRLGPLQKGGDHKSEIFKKSNNKEVL